LNGISGSKTNWRFCQVKENFFILYLMKSLLISFLFRSILEKSKLLTFILLYAILFTEFRMMVFG